MNGAATTNEQTDVTRATQAWHDSRVPVRFARAVEGGLHTTDSHWLEAYCRIVNSLGSGDTHAVVGQAGSGRTTLGAAVIFAASRAGVSGLYVRHRDAVNVLGDPAATSAASRLFTTPLLVLDNVEPLWPEQASRMDHMIDVRHSECGDTLILIERGHVDGPNLDLTHMQAVVGSHVSGCVIETGGVLSLYRSQRQFRGRA